MDVNRPLIINNGTIACHIPHQDAYFDSYLTCIAFKMPLYLERLYFGHISFVFSSAVLLISIFGNIKQTYKCFFINQALWDILLSYDFICDRPLDKWMGAVKLEVRQQWDEKPSNCIYQDLENSKNTVIMFIYLALVNSIVAIPFCSTFLLSFSRFLAIFCHHFYQKFITPIKVTIFVIIFTTIYIFFESTTSIYLILVTTITTNRCKQLWCSNSSICAKEYTLCTVIPFIEPSYIETMLLASNISNLTPAVLVIFTLIFMIANLSKIILQLYRQHKLKQKLVFSNFKIAVVLAVQCLTLFLIFLVRNLMAILQRFIPQNSRISWWPSWPDQVDYKSLTILKTVIDSIITLTVLSEYRQNIFRAFKFVLKPILKPFGKYQIFASFKSETSSTVVFLKSTSKIKMSY